MFGWDTTSERVKPRNPVVGASASRAVMWASTPSAVWKAFAAVGSGVWLRPFRDLIYTMPPYISSAQDISAIGAGITAAIAGVHG